MDCPPEEVLCFALDVSPSISFRFVLGAATPDLNDVLGEVTPGLNDVLGEVTSVNGSI